MAEAFMDEGKVMEGYIFFLFFYVVFLEPTQLKE